MSNIDDWKKKGFNFVDGKLTNKKPYNKYRNTKVTIDGYKFDSKKEAEYYGQLMLLLKAKKIKSFEKQYKMPINVNGIHIANYVLDFKVEHLNGDIEHIDIKAQKKDGKWITTSLFSIKKKLIEAIYGIKIILK